MMKIMSKLQKTSCKNFSPKLIIYLISLIEDVIIYSNQRSYKIEPFGYFVNIDKTRISKITHVHYNGKKELCKITTKTGKIIQATEDHIFPCCIVRNTVVVKNTYFSTKRLKSHLEDCVMNEYCLTDAEGKFDIIESVELLNGKHKVFDITIDDKLHMFIADGLLVHNCVTYDTDVDILNTQISEFEKISIFELYYKNMESKSLLTKLEYWLHKTIYKINKKTKG